MPPEPLANEEFSSPNSTIDTSNHPLNQVLSTTVASVRWQEEMKTALRSSSDVRRFLSLPDESAIAAEADFPVFAPRNYLDRATAGDPNDPLVRQVLALPAEDQAVPGFTPDPVGDQSARQVPGMLQKYVGRVLLITTGACAIHCRYCFRRSYDYQQEPKSLADWQPAFDAISEDSSISEVILSGGDPLTLTDDRLSNLVNQIDAIPHVERIRFHTRLPIVLPSRITTEFLELLTSLRSQPIMVVHSNHGNELQGDCVMALRSFVQHGIVTLNQAVLLAGINDSVLALENLCRRLVNIGVMPYYLSQLDRVTGAAHFEVPLSQGQQLLQQLAERLPGYAVPRYVQEIAGELHKVPVTR